MLLQQLHYKHNTVNKQDILNKERTYKFKKNDI